LCACQTRTVEGGQERGLDDPGALAIPARADHSDVRRNNLELVLRHLNAVGSDSRAGIAARGRLTRATVSRLVGELIELGLVREAGRDGGGRPGRPGTRLELDGQHVLAVGAEVNVDYVSLLAIDFAGREVLRRRRAFDAMLAGPRASIAALAELCATAVDDLTASRRKRATIVAGLTVAIPGLVDVAAGVVANAPNLRWRDLPVAALVRQGLGLNRAPVQVGNDANLAAIAEYRIGVAAGTPNLVYITGEVGIGGGIIVGGQPLLGTSGYGGEIGHMSIDPEGPRCACGRRGCWEAYIGLNALMKHVRSNPPQGAPPEAKVEPVARRARAGDRDTLAVLEELGRRIGIGAANIANVVDPQVIILGGYFVDLAQWILPAAKQALAAGTIAPNAEGPRLITSTLGFAAAARGGAIDAMNAVMSNPTMLLAR
jgi:predicted NBD/HSP70 family sugar kinase